MMKKYIYRIHYQLKIFKHKKSYKLIDFQSFDILILSFFLNTNFNPSVAGHPASFI